MSNLDIFMGNMTVVRLNCINSSTCSSSMGNLHTLYSSVNMEVVHLNYINSSACSACSSLMQNLPTTHSSVHIISQFKLRKQWCIQYTFIEIKNIHPKTYM